MPHVIRKPGVLQGMALAIFLTFVHTINDAITAILGALLPTLQVRFSASTTLLALIVATYSIASSVTQPIFGSLAEYLGLKVIGALFLSLSGVALGLFLVFILLIIGGMGSASIRWRTSISLPNRKLRAHLEVAPSTT